MTRPHLVHPRHVQSFMYVVLSLMAAAVVLPVFGLLGYMMIKGLAGLNPDLFLKGSQALLPAMVGTLYLVLLTAAIAAPIGIAAAIYLSEYAHKGTLVRLIRLAIINLAGVPSVVHGLFGLALFVMMLKFGRCLLSGAATMALLVLPLIISASEEALRQVPQRLRDGSLALGATRWQTIRRVVLPNALPGIMTGLILSISRAAGETAPILFTAAFLSLTNPYPRSLFDEILALPYQLFMMTSEMPTVPAETKWATAFVLVVLVLGMNIGAILWRTHLRRAKRW